MGSMTLQCAVKQGQYVFKGLPENCRIIALRFRSADAVALNSLVSLCHRLTSLEFIRATELHDPADAMLCGKEMNPSPWSVIKLSGGLRPNVPNT
jgi:hypothetical protein